MNATKEMKAEYLALLGNIKNHGKRKRVAKQVKKLIERKYGVVL
jgi:hypothetical protein